MYQQKDKSIIDESTGLIYLFVGPGWLLTSTIIFVQKQSPVGPTKQPPPPPPTRLQKSLILISIECIGIDTLQWHIISKSQALERLDEQKCYRICTYRVDVHDRFDRQIKDGTNILLGNLYDDLQQSIGLCK
ncbi:hypothetical protein DFA_02882 [Cavenderia fasciculata]|uniref:Uncharacterized protein n=1 Tax=Cavenderia fasciculata TaxID=261658 RepID=F4PIQ9_CACFS|nr:uncharacterized protein DFA_02882 [Cavenderia fasciculata]EGG24638.1 hypothetical protein DFA_02882 [Cavenderia fasciculata]|eukprot:XP_004362489.1 hypothetical protein DFA_02882 [Cavenderia fasciculata]